MALKNVFYFSFKVLSWLPNRNKASKLLKFDVFDIFPSSQIVCCSYVRCGITSSCETACDNLDGVQHCIFWFSDMRRSSVAFLCLSSDLLHHIELHHWLSTSFFEGERYLLLLIFEDIYNMYQQYSETPVNPTCILPQSASVDGTADMHCLLIDTNKNKKLATTISCYDDLSCKSWCFDRDDQLLPYLYYTGKYFEVAQSQLCHFELWHNDKFSWGAFLQKM